MTSPAPKTAPAEKLKQIIENVKWLRPLPMSATSILNALEASSTNAGEIADLIGLDQALTAQMLQAANSAYFGYSKACSTLNDAVMRLGFKRIKTLVLCMVASGPLARRLNGYRLGVGDLWNHSISAAYYAEKIGRAVGYPDPEQAYAAGLLHDIGKLLLDQYVQADYQNIIEIMHSHNRRLWQVEEELFGVDHAEAGGLMAARWNFPNTLVSAIRYHHMPSLAWEGQRLAAVINVANSFTPKDTISLAGLDGRSVSLDAMDILNLTDADLNRLWDKISVTAPPNEFPWSK